MDTAIPVSVRKPRKETKFGNLVRKFITTDFYFILVTAIVTVAWVLKSALIGFVGLISVSCFALIFADDITPLTVNIFAAFLMIYDNEVSTFLGMWPTFIPLGICLIIFVVRNVGRRKFRLGRMFFPQLAVTIALLIGGLGTISKENYLRALPTALVLGVGVLAVYLLYANFGKRDENTDYGLMVAKMLTYLGLAVCVELVFCIIRSGLAPADWNKAYWDTGWGNRNNIATYLLFTAPMCWYLATRYKRTGWLYIFFGVVQYACLIMTFSRGGILCGAIGGVFALVFLIWKSPSKKATLISIGVCVVLFAVAGVILRDKVKDMIDSLISRGTELSGRDLLYIEAWDVFNKHPYLGAGLGYMGDGPCPITTMQMYLFHSTFYQICACMGVVGIVAYAYYYGARLFFLFKNIKHKFNLFILVAWIGFEGYSMIDTGTFIPFPNMILVIVLTYILEILPSDDRFEGAIQRTKKA